MLRIREIQSLPLGFAAAAKWLQLCLTLCDPQMATHQVPLSLGFSRQEYWSGLLFPSPPWGFTAQLREIDVKLVDLSKIALQFVLNATKSKNTAFSLALPLGVCVCVCAYTSELGESTSEEFGFKFGLTKHPEGQEVNKVESFKEEGVVSVKLYQDN